MSVDYVQDAVTGDASLTCGDCGLSVQLPDASDDSQMTSFVTEHRACSPQADATCDACEVAHECWTCEDEVTCHATAVRVARRAAAEGSAGDRP